MASKRSAGNACLKNAEPCIARNSAVNLASHDGKTMGSEPSNVETDDNDDDDEGTARLEGVEVSISPGESKAPVLSLGGRASAMVTENIRWT